MPGRLILTTPMPELAAQVGVSWSGAEDGPRRNIQPGQEVVCVVPGPEIRRMRWGLIPSGRVNARGRPVLETIVNARSETVFEKSAFEGVARCVVPADGWYEWTGKRGRKTAWRITRAGGGLLWFAAICDPWRAPSGQEVWQVATVTCEPNADVREIHDRMGVLLCSEDVPIWLGEDQEAAAALMRTAPDGALTVEKAENVNWSAP